MLRWAFEDAVGVFLGEEDRDEFNMVFTWLRQKAVGNARMADKGISSLRECLVKVYREEEEQKIQEEERRAEENKLDDNPTKLMLLMNKEPDYADWSGISGLIYDARDTIWELTLGWRWPQGVQGPESMTVFHIAASKRDRQAEEQPDRRKDCLLWLFFAAIKRNFNFSQLSARGQTFLHLAVTYSNMAMLQALKEAEAQVYEHHPETPRHFFPNWSMPNYNGITPLGHWVCTNQSTAKSQESRDIYNFLAYRLVDQHWSWDQIQRHETQQWNRGQALWEAKQQSGGKAKHVPYMKHSGVGAKSPQKRRRVDVGAPRGSSSSASASKAYPAPSPFDVREPTGKGKGSDKSGSQWQWRR